MILFPREGAGSESCRTRTSGRDLFSYVDLEGRVGKDHPLRTITLAADKAYDAEDFINELRAMKVTSHVAQSTSGARLGD